MAETPPGVYGWVDLSREGSISIEDLGDDDFVKMLKEAQLESSQQGSSKISPLMTPSLPVFIDDDDETDLSKVYINTINDGDIDTENITDIFWSSRPNISPPKQWKLQRKYSSSCSLNHVSTNFIKSDTKDEDHGYLSLIITNLISLIVGTGIGVWLYKRNCMKHFNIFI